jgi:hypothetical protein
VAAIAGLAIAAGVIATDTLGEVFNETLPTMP